MAYSPMGFIGCCSGEDPESFQAAAGHLPLPWSSRRSQFAHHCLIEPGVNFDVGLDRERVTLGGMLSFKGRCFTFDTGADGYGRGEATVSPVFGFRHLTSARIT